MIVACERCATRFRLDESKLPPQGARVRCSRCKHAFFLAPPSAAEPAEAFDALAEEAAASEQPAAPEVTRELEQALAEPSRGSGREDESDWEFNDDFPGGGSAEPEVSSEIGSDREERADELDALLGDPSPAPGGSSLDELGDPESWDFLAGESRGEPPPPEPQLEPSRSEPRTPAQSTAPAGAGFEAWGEPMLPPASESLLAVRVGHAIGWSLTVVLLATVLLGVVRRPEAQGSPAAVLSGAGVSGWALEDLQGHAIENAPRGFLYVVSGRLRNQEPRWRPLGVTLHVGLLGTEGTTLVEAPAGRPLPRARLRLGDPRELREVNRRDAERLAERRVGPGRSVPFEAIFEALPPEAAGLAVTARPLRSSGASRGSPAAQRGEGSRRSPFPPRPLPSSE